jgi:hypothetical protein
MKQSLKASKQAANDATNALTSERELRLSLERELATHSTQHESKRQTTQPKQSNTTNDQIFKLEAEVVKHAAEAKGLKSELKSAQKLIEKQEGWISDYRQELTELKLVRDELYRKTLLSSDNRMNLYEETLQRLSERNKNDINYIRELGTEMRDRELKVISDSLDKTAEENKILRNDL